MFTETDQVLAESIKVYGLVVLFVFIPACVIALLLNKFNKDIKLLAKEFQTERQRTDWLIANAGLKREELYRWNRAKHWLHDVRHAFSNVYVLGPHVVEITPVGKTYREFEWRD